jgi:hypothetical protein
LLYHFILSQAFPNRIYDRYGTATAAAKTSGAIRLTKLGKVSPAAAFGVDVGFEPPVVVAAPLEPAVGEGPLPEPAVVDALESQSVGVYMMVKNVLTYLEECVVVLVAGELPDLVAVEDPVAELDEKAANMSEFTSTITRKTTH